MSVYKTIHGLKFYLQELIASRRSVVYTMVGAVLAAGAPLGWELVAYLKDNYKLNIDLYNYLFFSSLIVFSVFGFIMGYFHDQVKALADSDPLTGLLNQVSFYKIVNYLYRLAMRKEETISIVMLDIDYFKKVNDTNNHLVGSYVLKEIGKILSNITRNSDAVARFGGDEFIIFLSNVIEDKFEEIPERIRSTIEKHLFKFQKFNIQITVSVGVVVADATKKIDLKELVTAADEALYQAKHEGRNKVVIKKINASEAETVSISA